ncbi:hypothetical protein KFE25_013520 [Diacronema lutheri]|uniref:FAD dependent oxidoreductase domain-containing protein n=2 Tax=Diacronema lutheri TaxID=2081491 RepID=A0A8J5XU41_DIALT|nr:hypothetical protein KFE25_013520 [Diacronema lutheri]
MAAGAARYDAAVVGAGVIGLTTAYALSRAGLRVAVLERGAEVASGASWMSSGQVEPERVDHLVEYGNPLELGISGIARVASRHPHWLALYLHYRARTLASPGLSERMTADIRALGRCGIRTAREWDAGRVPGVFRFGRSSIVSSCAFPVDPTDPELLGVATFRAHQIATGSPRAMCVALEQICRERGVDFHLQRSCEGLRVRASSREAPALKLVEAIETPSGPLHAARVVVCTGLSADLLFPHVPVYGLIREYAYAGASAGLFGTDDVLMASLPKPAPGQHAYVCLLETASRRTLRLGGGAIVSPCPPPLSAFGQIAHRLKGHGEPLEDWVGCRAVSPDGAPIVGLVGGFANLYANCGQSFWGWTLSFGCADVLAELIARDAPVPPTLDPARWSVRARLSRPHE